MLLRNSLKLLVNNQFNLNQPINYFHISAVSNAKRNPVKPCDHWRSYNDKIYEPQLPDEARRPAFVCHVKEQVKYSYKRMWYIACFIRGMTIDEALKQLDFLGRKGSAIAKETLLEAQELAVKEHNVEFKTNLWVSESFVGRGFRIKGMRRHARNRTGRINHDYIHYFVTLEEGKPPLHYYPHTRPLTSEEMLNEWLEKIRNRKIVSSL